MDINLTDVSLTYMKNTPFEKKALNKININIPANTITGIIGHTGSGKSSLIQIIAGLIFPESGTVRVGNFEWGNKKKNLYDLRKKIGIVFQYPESQLFEETVEKDIAFGPKNFGFTEDEIVGLVKEAMERVNLSYDKFARRSPFELSGGQMRRVAIAGILAFKPTILILDEPTAGLDPKGKNELLTTIKELHEDHNITIILVSHSMDEIAKIACNLIVLNKGEILMEGTPEYIFNQMDELLKQVNLDIPDITKLISHINQKVKPAVPLNCFSIDELEEYLTERLNKLS